jgi:hypothetical protein
MRRPLDEEAELSFYVTELRETRAAAKAAWEDRSWVAVNQLKKQEREIFAHIQKLREAGKAHDPDEGLSEDQVLHQVLLPVIRDLGRPFQEEVYRVCLEVLGLSDDDDEKAN